MEVAVKWSRSFALYDLTAGDDEIEEIEAELETNIGKVKLTRIGRIFKATVHNKAACTKLESTNKIKIGYSSFRIKPWRPDRETTRCFKCQRYGHMARECEQETPVCPKCSGPHRKDD